MKTRLTDILKLVSETGFVSHPAAGGVFLALIILYSPWMALCGLIALVGSTVFAKTTGFTSERIMYSPYVYNPLLAGLSAGYFTEAGLKGLVLALFCGIIALLLLFLTESIFTDSARLPVLSAPFAVTSGLIYAAFAPTYMYFGPGVGLSVFTDWIASQMPGWLNGYLVSMGSVFFMPEAASGLVICIVLIIYSPVLWLLSIMGYYSGAAVVLLCGLSWVEVFGNPFMFNPALTAMAVGGYFTAASPRGYLISVVSAPAAALLLVLTQNVIEQSGILVFSLPFAMVTWAVLSLMQKSGYKGLVLLRASTPEETSEIHYTWIKRFGSTKLTVTAPFSGQWTVWQAFDGKWTHKGLWRHAYDFVITDERGKMCHADGLTLDDYYAFGKPVLAPTDGIVSKVVNNLPDCPPGFPDTRNNWGNHVIIARPDGLYVEISHFKLGSINVVEGDRVTTGQYIGLCGNSGNSPMPHIHLQLQSTPSTGAATLPFTLASFIQNRTFYKSGSLKEGDMIEPMFSAAASTGGFSPSLDDKFVYALYEGKTKIKDFTLTVQMEPGGSWCLKNDKGGKLYWGAALGGIQYFYRFTGPGRELSLFLRARPSVLPSTKGKLSWTDNPPLSAAADGALLKALRFLATFHPGWFCPKTSLSIDRDGSVLSKVTIPLLGNKIITTSEPHSRAPVKSIRSGKMSIRLLSVNGWRVDEPASQSASPRFYASA